MNIKQIPKLTCAKCGEVMMSTLERDEFVSKNLAGAASALKNPEIMAFSNNPVFKFLTKLAKQHPKTPISKLANENSERIKRFSKDQQEALDEIIKISDNLTLKAPQVIKRLNTIKHKLSEPLQETLEIMEVYSIKYPHNTFAEIFNKPEVKKYHSQINKFQREQYNLLSDKVFAKINTLCKSLPLEIQKEIEPINQQARLLTGVSYLGQDSTRLQVSVLYKDVLEKIPDKKLAQKLQKQINSLPIWEANADRTIEYLANKNDRAIVQYFANEITVTFEHIKPKSQKGSNKSGNGIYMHSICNKRRGTIPYSTMMDYFPDFADNIQKQMNKIIVFLTNKRLVGYEQLPQEVKKTLYENTEQRLRINIKKYLKAREKMAQIWIENTQRHIKYTEDRLKKENDKIAEYKKQIAKLQRELSGHMKTQYGLQKKHLEQTEKLKNANEHYKEVIEELQNDK